MARWGPVSPPRPSTGPAVPTTSPAPPSRRGGRRLIAAEPRGGAVDSRVSKTPPLDKRDPGIETGEPRFWLGARFVSELSPRTPALLMLALHWRMQWRMGGTRDCGRRRAGSTTSPLDDRRSRRANGGPTVVREILRDVAVAQVSPIYPWG